jgi:hypothetical protein
VYEFNNLKKQVQIILQRSMVLCEVEEAIAILRSIELRGCKFEMIKISHINSLQRRNHHHATPTITNGDTILKAFPTTTKNLKINIFTCNSATQSP